MRRIRAKAVFSPGDREGVEEELAFHREERIRDLVAEGWSERAARARAMRELGDTRLILDECNAITKRMRRRQRWRGNMESIVMFMADGWRQVRRRPTISVAVFAVTALAVASAVATTSLVWSTMVRPLPLGDSDRVFAIHTIDGRLDSPPRRGSSAPGDVSDWRTVPGFEAVSALNIATVTLFVGDEPQRISSVLAAQDIDRVLQLRPHLGRMFMPEDWNGTASVLMLTHEYWERAFGRDSSVVGRILRFSNGHAEVVGVLPPLPNLAPTIEGDIWLPFDLDANATRGATFLRPIARLAPGVPVGVAQAQLDGVMSRLAREEPTTNARRTAWIEPLSASLTWTSRPVLVFIVIAIAFVVLIACGNVTALLLGLASERTGEMSLRTALGAGAGQLRRLFLSESAVCCGLGTLAGVPLGIVALDAFLALYPGGLPRGEEVQIGGPAGGAAFLLVVLFTTLGALPQYRRLKDLRVSEALMSGTRIARDRGAERFRSLLASVQIALCTVLLVAGALLVRVYRDLIQTPAGFATRGLVAFNVTPPASRYASQADYLAFYDDLLDGIRSQPGVLAASYTSLLPFDRDNFSEGMVADLPGQVANQEFVLFQRVEPTYSRTLGLPLLAGRELSATDIDGAPRVALVNETLARRMFGSADVIGRRIGRSYSLAEGRMAEENWIEIVGVVGDKRHRELSQEPVPEIFLPRRQERAGRSHWIVVRSAEDPVDLLPVLRQLLRQADPDIAFASAAVMTERVALSMASQRFRSTLLGTLAIMAVLLAAIGVWSLASSRVAGQTREIGIRMSLGLSPVRARANVVAGALVIGLVGVVAGSIVSLAVARLVDTAVFGVPRIDGVTVLGVAMFLLGLTAMAALRPATRASGVDPMRAIQSR